MPYQLGYATKNWLREQELNLPVLAYETSEPPLLYSRVKVGGDEGSRTLIDRFTRPTLCYPVELHRHQSGSSFKFQVSSFEFRDFLLTPEF